MARARFPLRILIASGPTREPIDPVRYLSNYSTGTMGAQLASDAIRRGHRTTVLAGPGHTALPERVRVVPFGTTAELSQELYRRAPDADIVIMAAAVADYRCAKFEAKKLKRKKTLTLKLEATPDVIAGMPRSQKQVVVGFALETGNPCEAAKRKRIRKKMDLLLAQDASYGEGPFGNRKLRAWLLDDVGAIDLGEVTKRRVARVLLDKSEALWYVRNDCISTKRSGA